MTSIHSDWGCQDVKTTADRTFELYLFIGGNQISSTKESTVKHHNKRTI